MRVQGVLDGAGYDVQVTGRADQPVTGSLRVATLVDSAVRRRRRVLAGPTGPLLTVSPTRVESILALLAADTTVLAAEGGPAPVEVAARVVR